MVPACKAGTPGPQAGATCGAQAGVSQYPSG